MNLTHWVMTSTSAAMNLPPIECCRLFCGAGNDIVATACGNDLSINRSFRAFCHLIGWKEVMEEACFHDVRLESIKSFLCHTLCPSKWSLHLSFCDCPFSLAWKSPIHSVGGRSSANCKSQGSVFELQSQPSYFFSIFRSLSPFTAVKCRIQ